jgi:hypothetical protein
MGTSAVDDASPDGTFALNGIAPGHVHLRAICLGATARTQLDLSPRQNMGGVLLALKAARPAGRPQSGATPNAGAPSGN